MEYTHLGRLGLVVSRLCLGTMNFGPHASEADSHAIMDAAAAHGVNFFDTANVYGRHLGVGATEEIIGRWFAKGGGRRDKVVLASKVYGQMGDWPNEGRLSVLAIRKACEASLKRLRTDHIDLYQMHRIDRDAWWNEVWQAMELLVQQGKIVYVGSSNFAGWHIARANEIRARGTSWAWRLSRACTTSARGRWSSKCCPQCGSTGWDSSRIARCRAGCSPAHCPRWRKGGGPASTCRARSRSSAISSCAGRRLCHLGERPSDVALAWLLAQPGVTSPIIGPRTPDQLHASMRALEYSSATTSSRSSTNFPGPGGSAPEAYAW